MKRDWMRDMVAVAFAAAVGGCAHLPESVTETRTAATAPATTPAAVATTRAAVAATSGGPRSPAILPGNGINAHPFLYAGEYDTRKTNQSMFIVRDGKIVWQYSIPLHNPAGNGIQEYDDVTMLADGNILFSRMSRARGSFRRTKNWCGIIRAPGGDGGAFGAAHRKGPRADHAQWQAGAGDDFQYRDQYR